MYPLSRAERVALILLTMVARIGALDDYLGGGNQADTERISVSKPEVSM